MVNKGSYMDNWKENWETYLKEKFGNNKPNKFILNLGEIKFYLPPLLGVDSESFKAIQKNNNKIGIF